MSKSAILREVDEISRALAQLRTLALAIDDSEPEDVSDLLQQLEATRQRFNKDNRDGHGALNKMRQAEIERDPRMLRHNRQVIVAKRLSFVASNLEAYRQALEADSGKLKEP